MAEVKFKRKTTSEISNLPIDDGSFIVDYEAGKAYTDVGENRIQFSGSTKLNSVRKNSDEEGYSCNYINNELDRIENKIITEIATAYLSSEVSDVMENKIPLNRIDSNSDKLTLVSNGIRIGAGISKILVSGNVFYLSNTNNSYLWTSIRNQTANKELSVAIDNYNTYFASTSLSPKLIEVSEGDIIILFKIDNSTGTIRAGANTYLTVQVVEYV